MRLFSIIFILFLTSAINFNIITSYISLFLIILIILIKSPKSMRLSGGLRFWIFPFIFLIIISFDYKTFIFDRIKLISNMKIFIHLYVFSIIINLINDRAKLTTIYLLMDKYRFNKLKFMIVFAITIMKKMKGEITDIFFFYRLNNKGLRFIIEIPMLIYSVIRNSIKTCYDMVEVLYLRGLYEK